MVMSGLERKPSLLFKWSLTMNFADRVLKDVKRVLIPIRDPIRAQGAQAYMKKIAPYLGICAPDRRAATKPVFAALPTPTSQELGLAAVLLYAQREREYAYVANDLLQRAINWILPAVGCLRSTLPCPIYHPRRC